MNMGSDNMKSCLLLLVLFTCGAVAGGAADSSPGLPAILDLETAQRIAVAGNPGLQAARARVDQAATRIKQARAGYFPRLDASVSAYRTWLSNNSYDGALAQTETKLRAIEARIAELDDTTAMPIEI